MSKGVTPYQEIVEALKFAYNYSAAKEQQTHDMYSQYQKGSTQRRVKNSRSSDQVLKSKRSSRTTGPTAKLDPTKTTKRDRDDPHRRVPLVGDGAIMNARNANKKLRVSLGPRMSMNNNSFLGQLLNRTSRVKTQTGFLYQCDKGKRTFHFQHFRHSVHSDTTADNAGVNPFEYKAKPDGMWMMYPATYSRTLPAHKTPFAIVHTQSDVEYQKLYGSESVYSTYSLADLENISWNLQHGKALVPHHQSVSQTSSNSSTGAPASTIGLTIANAPYIDSPVNILADKFCVKSRLFMNNLLRNYTHAVPLGSNNVVYKRADQPGMKAKAVLKGGKVEYEFTNVESQPAVITLICYKLRQGYNGRVATAVNADPAPADVAYDNNFDNGFLQEQYIKTLQQSYLDAKGNLALKKSHYADGEGFSERKADEITTNAQYEFLPRLKPTSGSQIPLIEQRRVAFVLAAGETRSVEFHLPGAVYNPTSGKVGDSWIDPNTANQGARVFVDGVLTGPTEDELQWSEADIDKLCATSKQWNNMQYSIAVSVSGCDALNQISETVDAVEYKAIEGHTTSEACVQCRTTYTEDIGAMNMIVPTFDEPKTFGRLQDVEKSGNSSIQAVSIIPLEDTIRIAGGPVYTSADMDTTKS